jgi:hypothetical protein
MLYCSATARAMNAVTATELERNSVLFNNGSDSDDTDCVWPEKHLRNSLRAIEATRVFGAKIQACVDLFRLKLLDAL